MTSESNIFTWKCLSHWKHTIEPLVPEELRISLVDTVRRRRDEFKYLDDVTCFETLYSSLADYSVLVDSFTLAFPSTFQFVRMFHCCRPIDTDSYYSDGIRVLDFDDANALFTKTILGNPTFPQVTAAHLQTAFDETRDSYMRNGYVYFGLDDRYLAKRGHHYLKKGSEYAQSLGVIVNRECGADVPTYLTTQGQPTIFEVKIPVNDFGEKAIRELAPNVLFAWAYDVAHDASTPFHIDFSIELDHDLLPDFIIRHYNPTGTDG